MVPNRRIDIPRAPEVHARVARRTARRFRLATLYRQPRHRVKRHALDMGIEVKIGAVLLCVFCRSSLRAAAE